MLITLNAVERFLKDPEAGTMEIPVNVLGDLSAFMDYVRAEIVEPFCGRFLPAAKSMDQAWNEWTEWSQAQIDAVVDRSWALLCGKPEIRRLGKDVDMSYAHLRDAAEGWSPGAGALFESALKMGLKAESTLAARAAELGAKAHVQNEVARNRFRTVARMGLACLVFEHLIRGSSATADRTQWMLNRLAKLGTAAMQNTLRIVKWAEEGSGSKETMDG